jgi:hypothetical protein
MPGLGTWSLRSCGEEPDVVRRGIDDWRRCCCYHGLVPAKSKSRSVQVGHWVWSRSMMLPTHDKLPFPYCSAIQTTASEVAVPASLRLGPAGERPNRGGKRSTELLARLGLACLIPK